jgi:hypothetical protein
MKNTVCNINISFYTLPDEYKQINDKPEIAMGLKQFIYIPDKEPSEKE